MAEALTLKNHGVPYTPGSDVASGEILQLADGRACVVAGLTGIKANELGSVYTRGLFSIAAASATVFALGENVYWDVSANAAIPIASVADTDFLLGRAVKAKVNGQTVVQVDLNVPGYLQRRVTHHTADFTLTAADSGSIHTSVGAAGAIKASLPAAKEGLEYLFRVGAAQELRIDPNGTEVIALPSTGVASAAGKYIVADADGETVHIKCTKAGTWSVFGYTGTWTAEA